MLSIRHTEYGQCQYNSLSSPVGRRHMRGSIWPIRRTGSWREATPHFIVNLMNFRRKWTIIVDLMNFRRKIKTIIFKWYPFHSYELTRRHNYNSYVWNYNQRNHSKSQHGGTCLGRMSGTGPLISKLDLHKVSTPPPPDPPSPSTPPPPPIHTPPPPPTHH